MPWHSLLSGSTADVREAFGQLLLPLIKVTPFVERGYRAIRFEGQLGLDAVFGGKLVTKMASPTGFANAADRPLLTQSGIDPHTARFSETARRSSIAG